MPTPPLRAYRVCGVASPVCTMTPSLPGASRPGPLARILPHRRPSGRAAAADARSVEATEVAVDVAWAPALEAAGVGFEPTGPVKGQRFSRPRQSAALAPRRARLCRYGDCAEPRGRAELDERLGDGDAAVVVLEVLEDRDQRARGDRGAVERVDVLEAALAPDADPEPARLVVGRIRRGRDLAVAPLPGEPGLDVVLLRSRGAEVSGRDVDDAVGDLELGDELLLDRQQALVLVAGGLGRREHEHLHLVELVHAEQA